MQFSSTLSKAPHLLQCESYRVIYINQRGIVQRLVHRSPKPEIVVRFHVPLPSLSTIKKVSEMGAFCYDINMTKNTKPKEKLVIGQRLGQVMLLAAPITILLGLVTGNQFWLLYPVPLIFFGVIFRAWFTRRVFGSNVRYRWNEDDTVWERLAVVFWWIFLVGIVIWLIWFIVSKFI
ncbi:MAG: hypothetical protein JWO99_240 [Candidatus Saccharibacteria bacterium]|nr:hypothetical protein [Candidatus Saccharibacteria bacterium]